jgi:hypothetical protein
MVMSRFSLLLLLPLVFLFNTVRAQDQDYLKHGKTFNLCWFKPECVKCNMCEKKRYHVKIRNNADKKITGVSVKFYSDVFNRILEKDAKVAADVILPKQIGYLYICIPDESHWIISKITYDDGTTATFTLHDRMDNFLQEADECDCNLD